MALSPCAARFKRKVYGVIYDSKVVLVNRSFDECLSYIHTFLSDGCYAFIYDTLTLKFWHFEWSDDGEHLKESLAYAVVYFSSQRYASDAIIVTNQEFLEGTR